MKMKNKSEMTLAIPPEDYKGQLADWETKLIAWGLLEPGTWYGDIKITIDEWWQLLEECERDA